jgi:hypothetical protein
MLRSRLHFARWTAPSIAAALALGLAGSVSLAATFTVGPQVLVPDKPLAASCASLVAKQQANVASTSPTPRSSPTSPSTRTTPNT